MQPLIKQPVVSGARFFLAHTPGLVCYGSKPSREISKDSSILNSIRRHLRPWDETAAYPPHRVFLGHIRSEDLSDIQQPWFEHRGHSERWGPHGEIMPEDEFYGLLKICDVFNLVWLEEKFTRQIRNSLFKHPLLHKSDLKQLGEGYSLSQIKEATGDGTRRAIPLGLRDGTIVGCISRAHDQDHALSADVLLENLCAKVTASMATRTLLHQCGHAPSSVEYVINTGEEAVGDRYQRGGGNLAKAVAEMCDCVGATGSDIKCFCCGPIHGLAIAGALVASGIFEKVVLVAGCSLAKLGMKFQGHLKNDFPILEDVLAGVAILVESNDNHSPILRLDAIGRHTVDASSQQVIFQRLVSEPLQKLGLRFQDIDKYATELHNPEITEPAGSGNVPEINYRTIASLAALSDEINRSDIADFVKTHGMPGFSPTQGHIASAIPFMTQALDRLVAAELDRIMFVAKGSLFLGRMTQLTDGLSVILERNP